jgi:arginine/lysine/ornithine decarboxylase
MSNFKISYLGIFLNKQQIVQELEHLHFRAKYRQLHLVYTEVHFMNNQKSRFISFGPLSEVENTPFV